MRNFEFYEFAGVLTPGAIILVGLAWLFPSVVEGRHILELSAGAFGMVLILAYAAGHLIQIVGNAVEEIYWRLWGGKPTTWVVAGKRGLISEVQRQTLQRHVRHDLSGFNDQPLAQCGGTHWLAATRQIYAIVNKAGVAERVDIFNANYSLCRGMAAAFLILLCSSIYATRLNDLKREAVLAVLFAISLYRMHRFATYYARELFIQFMQLHGATEERAAAQSSDAQGAT